MDRLAHACTLEPGFTDSAARWAACFMPPQKVCSFNASPTCSADGGQLTPEQGSILLGLRGGCAAEVTLQTVVHDLHSGMKGGQVKPVTLAARPSHWSLNLC